MRDAAGGGVRRYGSLRGLGGDSDDGEDRGAGAGSFCSRKPWACPDPPAGGGGNGTDPGVRSSSSPPSGTAGGAEDAFHNGSFLAFVFWNVLMVTLCCVLPILCVQRRRRRDALRRDTLMMTGRRESPAVARADGGGAAPDGPSGGMGPVPGPSHRIEVWRNFGTLEGGEGEGEGEGGGSAGGTVVWRVAADGGTVMVVPSWAGSMVFGLQGEERLWEERWRELEGLLAETTIIVSEDNLVRREGTDGATTAAVEAEAEKEITPAPTGPQRGAAAASPDGFEEEPTETDSLGAKTCAAEEGEADDNCDEDEPEFKMETLGGVGLEGKAEVCSPTAVGEGAAAERASVEGGVASMAPQQQFSIAPNSGLHDVSALVNQGGAEDPDHVALRLPERVASAQDGGPGLEGGPSPAPSTAPEEGGAHLTVPNTCAICLSPYELGSSVTWSSSQPRLCRHAFHSKCILTWLTKNDKPLCPCCRQDFVSQSELLLRPWRRGGGAGRCAGRRRWLGTVDEGGGNMSVLGSLFAQNWICKLW